MPLVLLLAALAAFVFYLISLYNHLLRLQYLAKSQWDAVQAALQQQQEQLALCLPHAHEQRETLIGLRASLAEASRVGNVGRIRELHGEWQQQLALLAALPANLQQALQSSETSLLAAAAAYDEAATGYNLRLAQFPGNLLAGLFGLVYCPLLHLGRPH